MRRYFGARIRGIPPAPPVKVAFNRADKWFDAKKVELADKIPFLTPDEVNIKSKPYHENRIHHMKVAGYDAAVAEFQLLLKKETRERKVHSQSQRRKSTSQDFNILQHKDKLKLMLDVLCKCQEFHDKEDFEAETHLRKDMGEKFLKSGDIWLAKHFFFSALQASRKIQSTEKEHFQAELHCLLAFLIRENSENLEQVLDAAINHLIVSRQLSKDQPWQFKPDVLHIRLKKAMTLHGMRSDYSVIDGCAMTLYMIATLLEHEILIGLANHLLKPAGHHHTHAHHVPTEKELELAYKYANHALKLAYEVRQNDALLAALMRFGVVLRQTGQFDEALEYFNQMVRHAELSGDHDAFAIGLQNLAHCYVGKHQIFTALEHLALEREACEAHRMDELEADTLKAFGHLLLLEGHLWEAEECYSSAYATTVVVEERHRPHHSHQENTFVMWAVTAGQQVWSRLAGLARNDEYKNLVALMEWKNRRAPLPPANLYPSDLHLDLIEEVYVPFVPLTEEEAQNAEAMSADTFYANNNFNYFDHHRPPPKSGSSSQISLITHRASLSAITSVTSSSVEFTWNTASTADEGEGEEKPSSASASAFDVDDSHAHDHDHDLNHDRDRHSSNDDGDGVLGRVSIQSPPHKRTVSIRGESADDRRGSVTRVESDEVIEVHQEREPSIHDMLSAAKERLSQHRKSLAQLPFLAPEDGTDEDEDEDEAEEERAPEKKTQEAEEEEEAEGEEQAEDEESDNHEFHITSP